MIYITAVHMEPRNGTTHQHIAQVRWLDSSTNATDHISRAGMIKWINEGHQVFVRASPADVQVVVVDGTPPYLRTEANGVPTDNLLSLPRY